MLFRSVSNVVIITANTSTVSSNGLHVGTYVEQVTTGAYGYIAAIPRENYFTYSNVEIIAVGETTGTFDNTSNIAVYTNSNKTTNLGLFTPLTSRNGYGYV